MMLPYNDSKFHSTFSHCFFQTFYFCLKITFDAFLILYIMNEDGKYKIIIFDNQREIPNCHDL